MRIAFDGRPLLGSRTGVGVWLEGLLRGLAATTDWRLLLCLPRPGGDLGVGDVPGLESIVSAVPMLGTIWLHTLAAPMVEGLADLYVGTLGILPRRLATPAVVVVHDLTPRTRPTHHTLANRFCFNAYFEESVARADLVVCDSETTRVALAGVLPAQARTARVVPPWPDPSFAPPADDFSREDTRTRFASGRPFIVQLGTLEPRKGVTTLLAAHAMLLRGDSRAPDLVLAGSRGWGGGWLEKALASHPQPARVHLPGYVTRGDARALLCAAEVVVVASDEEGFGLPLAEAFACGAACVASDAPALVELSAGAALHARRGNAAALAGAIASALEADNAASLRLRSRERAAALVPERTISVWRELLGALTIADDVAHRH